ncbi:LacI family DNA-binding transcriptional regulator [Bacillus sp. B15-48]|uniref:LacI family DNA-binding transcriptional regulator n=1 Tax=Bacillus sp. B15-48 TaxID=1548601 RepID=UPI00193F2C19|nr:LacI family DNA-binding transcriptional regulator [Bacillus sp. B15-48]MBM4761133.1 LacI family DNA-binding transcriptional regulator [Bacillus sp. B15-48]
MSVTIKDIAKMLNVSHATVSRALNNSPLISKETTKRVQKLAEELNYVPNYSAKSLVKNKSYTIALFFSTIDSPSVFFHETVRGVNHVMTEEYNLVIKGIDDLNDDYTSIDAKRFDGIILMSQSDSDNNFIYNVREKNIPLVVLNRDLEDGSIINILSADKKGAYRAVSYLIEKGHRQIAIIEGKKEYPASRARTEGYLSALVDHDIAIKKDFMVQGSFTLESGYRAMKFLLKRKSLPTAVFCSNDEMAVGAMKAITQAGLHIPKDISIMGFDDSQFTSYINPSLTTVRRGINELSRVGAEKLLNVINHRQRNIGEKVYIDTKLVERESIATI